VRAENQRCSSVGRVDSSNIHCCKRCRLVKQDPIPTRSPNSLATTATYSANHPAMSRFGHPPRSSRACGKSSGTAWVMANPCRQQLINQAFIESSLWIYRSRAEGKILATQSKSGNCSSSSPALADIFAIAMVVVAGYISCLHPDLPGYVRSGPKLFAAPSSRRRLPLIRSSRRAQ